MSLAVRVTFLNDTYDAAASSNPMQPEWPPSPARLFSAFRAGVRGDDELDALRWLEQQPPPLILASPAPVATRREAGYVVTNATASKPKHQVHPGRVAQLRRRTGSVITDASVTIVWDCAAPQWVVTALDRLAARTPYLGRSSTHVLITVGEEARESLRRGVFRPTELATMTHQIDVPYAGMVDALDQAFVTGERAADVYRSMPYRYDSGQVQAEPSQPRVQQGPFERLVVLGFPTGVTIPASWVGHVTVAFRRAVLSAVGDPLPPALTGHDADGLPHAAFLPLPFAGVPNADGHVMGVGLALPAMDSEELDRIESDVGAMRELAIPDIGRIETHHDPFRLSPWTLTAPRWSRAPHGQTRWATVTPLVIDRFPRRRERLEEIVAAACVTAGFPEPVSVVVSRSPMVAGGADMRPHQIPRKSGDRRPYVHALLEFAEPVVGPVVIGALRYLGMGLCVPYPRPRDGEA